MTGDQVLVPRSGPLSPRTQVRKLGTLCYELQSLLGALQAEVAAGVPLPEDELAAAVRQMERLPEKLEAAWRWVRAAQLAAPADAAPTSAAPAGSPASPDRRRAPRAPHRDTERRSATPAAAPLSAAEHRSAPPAAAPPAGEAPPAVDVQPLPVAPESRADPMRPEARERDPAPCEAPAAAAAEPSVIIQPAVAAEPSVTVQPAPAADVRAARLAALCADYQPAPAPALGLPVPLPASWQEDPHFRLADPLILGTSGRSAQYGTLGRLRPGRQRVGLDLSEGFCLSSFSVPGGGKSYLAHVILQMALQPLRYLNELPRPLCGLSFHCPGNAGYEPEVLASAQPNQNAREALDLMEGYGALPAGLSDVVLLVPEAQVLPMRRRHPSLRVFPILFTPQELGADGWRALLGVNDAQDGTLYGRMLRGALGELREELSLGALERLLAQRDLSADVRRLIETRLSFVRPYLSEGRPLRRLLRPGRLIVVDVRDAWMPRAEAMALFAVLTSVLSRRPAGQDFGLIVSFDEAHRYVGERGLRAEIERLARERRHLNLSLLLSSQDPLSVPPELIALSDVLALGKIQSEAWLKRIVRCNGALRFLRPEMTARLGRGRMAIWSERQHLDGLSPKDLLPANIIDIRPQVGHHGGATKRHA